MNEKLFPCINIAIAVCASADYAVAGDLRRCIYWLAAAVLTICVTF
jgi:5-enolpyruvylshikimate-3-phosphate synthase